MFTTCIFCNRPLGENRAIETFPVGRRLAFDGHKGRLWVVCSKCERWNLSPIEERWEAVEECERLFRECRLRMSTDNVGLAKLKDGFVGFIGGIEPGQAEEPIWDAVVQIDDRLATVWVKYELIFNGEFHHCGVDAFELWRSDEGWKIFQLTDTSRTEDCWHQP